MSSLMHHPVSGFDTIWNRPSLPLTDIVCFNALHIAVNFTILKRVCQGEVFISSPTNVKPHRYDFIFIHRSHGGCISSHSQKRHTLVGHSHFKNQILFSLLTHKNKSGRFCFCLIPCVYAFLFVPYDNVSKIKAFSIGMF